MSERTPSEPSKGIVPGLILIALGLIFLFQNLGWRVFAWDRIWPLFVLGAGVAFLAGYVLGQAHDPGYVFVGTAATLIALFFFTFTFGVIPWRHMDRLWPMFVIIGGLSFFALWAAEGFRDWGVFSTGLLAIVIGVIAFPFTFGLLGRRLALLLVRLWPLLLVLIGVGLLAQFFLGGERRT
ncbi:MAG TPA: hypothetical protein EYH31_05815 [Anaerolineae bacterium]|nr:hypothetical protein [Anaerolineae bacterium]